MRAVSNTSPLSNLAVIGRLSLLKSQFSEIWVPPAVVQELESHPDPVALAEIQAAIQAAWITPASPEPVIPSVARNLALPLLSKRDSSLRSE